jgi:hypothetical protein
MTSGFVAWLTTGIDPHCQLGKWIDYAPLASLTKQLGRSGVTVTDRRSPWLIARQLHGCTLQGMVRVRSGQAAAWPLVSGRSVRRGSGVKRDFACTSAGRFSPVPVVLRAQSRLILEGRARTISGPSPDLSQATCLRPRPDPDSKLIKSLSDAHEAYCRETTATKNTALHPNHTYAEARLNFP